MPKATQFHPPVCWQGDPSRFVAGLVQRYQRQLLVVRVWGNNRVARENNGSDDVYGDLSDLYKQISLEFRSKKAIQELQKMFQKETEIHQSATFPIITHAYETGLFRTTNANKTYIITKEAKQKIAFFVTK